MYRLNYGCVFVDFLPFQDFVPWDAPSELYHLESFCIPLPLSAMYSHRELFDWKEDDIIKMLNEMICTCIRHACI